MRFERPPLPGAPPPPPPPPLLLLLPPVLAAVPPLLGVRTPCESAVADAGMGAPVPPSPPPPRLSLVWVLACPATDRASKRRGRKPGARMLGPPPSLALPSLSSALRSDASVVLRLTVLTGWNGGVSGREGPPRGAGTGAGSGTAGGIGDGGDCCTGMSEGIDGAGTGARVGTASSEWASRGAGTTVSASEGATTATATAAACSAAAFSAAAMAICSPRTSARRASDLAIALPRRLALLPSAEARREATPFGVGFAAPGRCAPSSSLSDSMAIFRFPPAPRPRPRGAPVRAEEDEEDDGAGAPVLVGWPCPFAAEEVDEDEDVVVEGCESALGTARRARTGLALYRGDDAAPVDCCEDADALAGVGATG